MYSSGVYCWIEVIAAPRALPSQEGQCGQQGPPTLGAGPTRGLERPETKTPSPPQRGRAGPEGACVHPLWMFISTWSQTHFYNNSFELKTNCLTTFFFCLALPLRPTSSSPLCSRGPHADHTSTHRDRSALDHIKGKQISIYWGDFWSR